MRVPDDWVYVIDDDFSMRESLSSLARSRGWQVKTFESAQAFLQHPRPRAPSCLILDVHLQGQTGPELHQQLRRTRDSIPIIYLTGDGNVPAAVRAMKAGAVEFLTKPFDHQALLGAIQQCLARRPAQPQEPCLQVLEFEPFRLDLMGQCLWRDDGGSPERILLTPKALAVLQYLLEHPGRLVGEQELLRALWPGMYVQPEAVKSQLYEIRKALGDNPREPRFIETLHRRGYRFIAPVRRAGTSGDSQAEKLAPHGRLAGRCPGLAALLEHLRSSLGGQRRVVFVTGELGIGKTALVDEFQRVAVTETPWLRVARGYCVEGQSGSEIYYPVLEALEGLCRQSAGIVDILAAHAPTWLAQLPGLLTEDHRRRLHQEILGATRMRMFRELVQALEVICAEQPLLMVLEDLQWADGPTLDLVAALARHPGPAQLLLVGTARPVNRPISKHPLPLLMSDLLARGLCQQVELEPLMPEDIAAWLSGPPRGSPQSTAAARRLRDLSGGNPLFLHAVLDQLGELQLASHTDRGWELKTPWPEPDPPVPPSVEIIIESQLRRLGQQEKAALEAAVRVGLVFTAAAVARSEGLDIEPLRAVFESLARRKLILSRDRMQVAAGGEHLYRFINPLYPAVLVGQSISDEAA